MAEAEFKMQAPQAWASSLCPLPWGTINTCVPRQPLAHLSPRTRSPGGARREDRNGKRPEANPVLSSLLPSEGRTTLLLGSEKGDECAQTKQRQGRAENPTEPFRRVQSVSSGPGLLPSCPAPQHSCLNHTEAARPATAEACPYPLTFPTRVQTVNPLGDRGQAPTGRKGSRLNSHPKTVSAPPQAGGSPLSDSWWLAG